MDKGIQSFVRTEPVNQTVDMLRLRMKLSELGRQASQYGNLHPNDASLNACLDLCTMTRTKVKREQAKIVSVLDKLRPAVTIDEKAKTRYQYLEYVSWFIENHSRRAEAEAIRRRKFIHTIITKEKQQEELRRCREGYKGKSGIEYWFDNYAWIVDPRNNILFAFPFELYPFQREALEWIMELVYVEKTDGLIDKSRDMGVTWLFVCICVYCWLFPEEGAQFHALITSYREDEVDKKGVPGTIFEKIRQEIRLLPSWMLPRGFNTDEHMTHMRIVNPENGSTIVGTTANAETGRSGRYTIIIFDEMASIQHDISSATAASQSTNSRFFISTPKGKLNYFAELRFTGDIPVKSFHWRKHPFKDERWYNGQKLKMSKEMIAQELDIDYEASQTGLVYEYNEVYHVITKSDFIREVAGSIVFDERLRTTRFRMPVEWWLGRDHDWGSSDSNGEHANMTYWFSTAKIGTRTRTYNIDIGGAVFVYRELLMPPHSTVRQVAKRVKELQAPDSEQERMQCELMSHEALSERDTYEQEHGLYYEAWETDYNAGIAQVRDYLEIQHKDEPHPFREQLKDKPVVMGRPMLYFIVDDEQGECYFDEGINRWQVRPAIDAGGLARLRAEISVYHYPVSEAGKPLKKQRPEKRFDDAMDCLRCMAVTFPPIADYTKDEQLESLLPLSLQKTEARKATPEEQAEIWIARQMYIHEESLKDKVLNGEKGKSYRTHLMDSARKKAGRNRR